MVTDKQEIDVRGPNMSYCMCENTLLALRQVIDAMVDEGPMFLHDLSRSERESFTELFHACESLLNLSDEMVENEEEQCISPRNDE